jgi:hypothetical protein
MRAFHKASGMRRRSKSGFLAKIRGAVGRMMEIVRFQQRFPKYCWLYRAFSLYAASSLDDGRSKNIWLYFGAT